MLDTQVIKKYCNFVLDKCKYLSTYSTTRDGSKQTNEIEVIKKYNCSLKVLEDQFFDV
jgi:hypothetical protein